MHIWRADGNDCFQDQKSIVDYGCFDEVDSSTGKIRQSLYVSCLHCLWIDVGIVGRGSMFERVTKPFNHLMVSD